MWRVPRESFTEICQPYRDARPPKYTCVWCVCLCTHLCICVHTCVYKCVSTCVYKSVYTCLCVCVFICMCLYTCTHVCIRVCIRVCVCGFDHIKEFLTCANIIWLWSEKWKSFVLLSGWNVTPDRSEDRVTQTTASIQTIAFMAMMTRGHQFRCLQQIR